MKKLRGTKVQGVSYQPNVQEQWRPASPQEGSDLRPLHSCCPGGVSGPTPHPRSVPLLTVFCSRLWSLTGPKLTAPAVFTQPGSPHCFYQHQATQSLSPKNSDFTCTLFPLHYSPSILTACSDLLLLQRQKCLAVSCVKFSSRTQHTLSPIF